MAASEIALYTLFAIIAIIVIRVSFTFNINEWQESRRKTQAAKLKNMCPHVCITEDGDNIVIKSLFVSPPGTIAWRCQQCGLISYDDPGSDMKYWQENPQQLQNIQEAFCKQAKKMKIT